MAVLLFLATCFTCFVVYGTQWSGGDPFTDAEVAGQSARFAVGLMSILLAHEMGHYVVARRHGFRLSLPYFLPLPFAFGTLGAIIRLKTMPRSRTALLEMGAAGPLAGFAVALVVLGLGMGEITAHEMPELVMPWPPPEPAPPPEWLVMVDGWLAQIFSVWPLSMVLPQPEEGTLPLMILANPPAMDLLGELLIGRIPGRYDELGPLGLAGWAGCLLTGINLLPIGQLDGGHVLNAVAPRWSRRVSRGMLVVAFLGGMLWAGWIVWAVLLLVLRAWIGLDVPERPGLTPRAKVVAGLTLICLVLTLMPRPLELEQVGLDEVIVKTPEGEVIPTEQVEAWRAVQGASGGEP